MATSNYLENILVDAVLRDVDYVSPASVWLALFTDDPTDAGSGTEVATASYGRVQITFIAPTDGTTSNSAELAFAQATESWGTITHIGVYDAETVGNLLYHGVLSASKAIDINDTFKVALGDLDITLS